MDFLSPFLLGRRGAAWSMKLSTRVFELSNRKYRNLVELAQTMEISQDLIYRVRKGERGINRKFIIEATKAFPGYKLDDLFYVDSEKSQDNCTE